MTDQVQAQQSQPLETGSFLPPLKAKEAPKVNSREEVQQIKNALVNILQQCYRNFIHIAGQLNVNRDALLKAIEYFDAGFLDLQKGIVLAEITHVPAILIPPEPQPPAASVAVPEPQVEEQAQAVAETEQTTDNADAA